MSLRARPAHRPYPLRAGLFASYGAGLGDRTDEHVSCFGRDAKLTASCTLGASLRDHDPPGAPSVQEALDLVMTDGGRPVTGLTVSSCTAAALHSRQPAVAARKRPTTGEQLASRYR